MLSQFIVVPSADPARRPRMPCGRKSRTTISTARAPTYFNSVGIHSVEIWMNKPDDEAADQRAQGRAEAAEGHGGEDEQQDLEAHLVSRRPGRAPRITPPSAARPPPIVHTRRMSGRRRCRTRRRGPGCRRPRGSPCPAGCRPARRTPPARTTRAIAVGDQVLRRDQERSVLHARLGVVVGEVARLAAEEVQEDVAHQQRQADRDDHHGHQVGAALAQPAPERAVLEVAQCRRRSPPR